MSGRHQSFGCGLALMLAVCWHSCQAAVINVTTNDNYTKIEGANPGDQVLIAPGTYAFRVYLTKQATPTNPVVIAAPLLSTPRASVITTARPTFTSKTACSTWTTTA